MHPLVQLATRKWLEVHEEIEQKKGAKKFPVREHAYWETCEALELHTCTSGSSVQHD